MEEHPWNCCCADCMPDWPLTPQEVEEERQKAFAEELEGAGFPISKVLY